MIMQNYISKLQHTFTTYNTYLKYPSNNKNPQETHQAKGRVNYHGSHKNHFKFAAANYLYTVFICIKAGFIYMQELKYTPGSASE